MNDKSIRQNGIGMLRKLPVMLELWQYGPEGAAKLGEEAVRALVELSLESSPKLRSDAVQALVLMGKEAVPELLHQIQFADGDIKIKSALALGAIGESVSLPEALDTLQALKSDDNIEGRRIARLALAKIEKRIGEGERSKSQRCRKKEAADGGARMAGVMLDGAIRAPERGSGIGKRICGNTGKTRDAPKIEFRRKNAVNM